MVEQTKRLQRVHERALERFNNVQGTVKDEREQCLEDRRFYSISGSQWEGPLSEMYENRPKFEMNKVHLSVIRIINEYRNNRITVDFVDRDNQGDDAAQVCDGLYRADEQDSEANEAYDNAFEEAVGGGIGAWRLRACYEDEDGQNDYQRIKIEPIFDADSSVFFDLAAKRQDKKDAQFCFVIDSMQKDEYEEMYKDDIASWPKAISQTEFDWSKEKVVYIAEYFEIEKVNETVHVYETIGGVEERYTDTDFEDDEELLGNLAAVGSKKVSERTFKKKKVHKYILSGGKVLEDCGIIAGSEIPIVPVYGKRWVVDGIERAMGHVRLAKDAQRLNNMQISSLAELSSLFKKEKPIFTPEQIANHALAWGEDNIKDHAFLMVDPATNANGESLAPGPVGYTRVPNIPPALATLIQSTNMDIKELTGSQDNGELVNPNVSGVAMEMAQGKLDMQTFIYMSNFAKGMKRCGEIWLSMAKDLYIEEGRKMLSLDKGGSLNKVELMMPMIDEEGQEYTDNDLSKASFDVVSSVGPSSSSKKAATVRAITGVMQAAAAAGDQESLQVLLATVMSNLEGEGTNELAEYSRRKLVNMGVVEPTPDDIERMQQASQANAQPDPNTQYLQALALEAQAKAGKAQADIGETQANTELKQAQTAETLAGIEQDQIKTIAEVQATIQPKMNENLI